MTWSPTVLVGCAGLGGLTIGAQAAGYRVAGAIDIDPAACRDHEYLTGVPCTQADIAAQDTPDWRRICPTRPDVFAWSPPCQGFSGCLPEARSQEVRYRRLNAIAQWGILLATTAWDTPPPIILLENVPRMQSRGRDIIDGIVEILHAAGYAVAETTHDCGELGGLAQRRRRFLLIARHKAQVPEFVYEPPRRRVRGVGEVLGELPVPLPGSAVGGPMHRLPRLSAMNWLRLALIPAGGDWRNLPESVSVCGGDHSGGYGVQGWDDPARTVRGEARVQNTVSSVQDPRLPPRAGRINGGFGVEGWETPAHAVVGEGTVRNTWGSIADPRLDCAPRNTAYGVTGWDDESGTVLASSCHDNGPFSVTDPRVTCHRREGSMGVTGWEQESTAVIAQGNHHNGPWQVADPRLPPSDSRHPGRYGVEAWDGPSHVVTGDNTRVGGGWASAVVDPRITDRYRGAKHVHGWAEPSHCIIGSQKSDGSDNVADPRVPMLVGPAIDVEDRSPTYLIIRAADGTWHRPMTTLELAALQGLPVEVNGAPLKLDGGSHGGWRKRIGNAVPAPTAEAIFATIRRSLEASRERGLLMSGEPVWVSPELSA